LAQVTLLPTHRLSTEICNQFYLFNLRLLFKEFLSRTSVEYMCILSISCMCHSWVESYGWIEFEKKNTSCVVVFLYKPDT